VIKVSLPSAWGEFDVEILVFASTDLFSRCTGVMQGEHEQYTLTIGMMLGIRVAVGRPQQLDDLTLMDFMQVDKYLFPPKGEY